MKTKRKSLWDKAWKNFRGYILERDTDWRGWGNCISCGAQLNTDEGANCQAGHYDHGKQKEFYFNPKNVHLQCRRCNYYGGVKTVQFYTLNMVKKYGVEFVERIKRAKTHYYNNQELKYLAEKYAILWDDERKRKF